MNLKPEKYKREYSNTYYPEWIEIVDMKIDKRIRKNLLYHGTSDVYLECIKKDGLIVADNPGLGATGWESGENSWIAIEGESGRYDQIGSVAVTNRILDALTYASITVTLSGIGGNNTVFVIDREMLEEELLYRRESSISEKRNTIEFDYNSNIHTSAIIGYWRYSDRLWKFYKNPIYR